MTHRPVRPSKDLGACSEHVAHASEGERRKEVQEVERRRERRSRILDGRGRQSHAGEGPRLRLRIPQATSNVSEEEARASSTGRQLRQAEPYQC